MLKNISIHAYRFFLCNNISLIENTSLEGVKFIIPKEIANYIGTTYVMAMKDIINLIYLMHQIVGDYPEEYGITFYGKDVNKLSSLRTSASTINENIAQLYRDKHIFRSCIADTYHKMCPYLYINFKVNLVNNIHVSFGRGFTTPISLLEISNKDISIEEFESFIYDVLRNNIEITHVSKNGVAEELFI